MEAGPPDDPAAGLSIISEVDTGVIELQVRGRWSRDLSLEVYTALRNCLAEHPPAIIIDLHRLSDLDAASTSMWLAGSRAASALRPPADLVLIVPPTRQLAGQLRRLGAVRCVPIYATVRQARLAVAARLAPPQRLQLDRLPPGPASVGVAADAVAVACTAWGLPDLVGPGRRMMSRLVADAVTEMTLAISLRGADLHLAVQRAGPRGATGPPEENGPCGTAPTRDGTVVWGIVRPRPQPRR